MCNPISLLMSRDSWHGPSRTSWNHSHSQIALDNNLPDGLLGDVWVRVEVTPPFPFPRSYVDTAGQPLASLDGWCVYLDEARAPSWWKEDKAAQEERALRYAAQWYRGFPPNLIPGIVIVVNRDSVSLSVGAFATVRAGDRARITGERGCKFSAKRGAQLLAGDNAEFVATDSARVLCGGFANVDAGHDASIIAGDHAKIAAGHDSRVVAGARSRVTVGDGSTVVAGTCSHIEAGVGSTICWTPPDPAPQALKPVVTGVIGENGLLPRVYYTVNSSGEIVRAMP